MDKELFELAIRASLDIEINTGIGTMSEKRVHSTLKYYVSPDMDFHEKKYCGFVCDAVTEQSVFEIQSRAFDRLRRKLDKILPDFPLTVVYPVIRERMIILTDESTGETVKRKSPKKGSIYSVIPELYKVRSYLHHPNFYLRLITISAIDHRVKTLCKKNTYKRYKPKNYTKHELIPSEIHSDITLSRPDDYTIFIPKGLPEEFLSSDFAIAAHIPRTVASTTLLILSDIGLVKRIARKKEGYLYCLDNKKPFRL